MQSIKHSIILIFFSIMTVIGPQSVFAQINTPVDGSVSFSVRTVSNNGTYSPRNVLAIWVKNAQGQFVISRKVMAANRKQHLVKWVASSANSTVNAVTGATLSNHQLHTITWDCRDVAGNLVPDGVYEIWVEFTERNSASGGAAGPSTKVVFTKGNDPLSISPADETYFKEMQLNYTPLNVGIAAEFTERLGISAFPNPFTDQVSIGFVMPASEYIQIAVYDETGRRLAELVSSVLPAGKQMLGWDGTLNSGKTVAGGMYYIRFFYQGRVSIVKLVKAN